MTDAVKVLEEYDYEKSSRIDRYRNKITKLGEDLEDHVDDFLDAAEDAGVDDKEFEDMEDVDVPDLMETAAMAVGGYRACDYSEDAVTLAEFWQMLDDRMYDMEDFLDDAEEMDIDGDVLEPLWDMIW